MIGEDGGDPLVAEELGWLELAGGRLDAPVGRWPSRLEQAIGVEQHAVALGEARCSALWYSTLRPRPRAEGRRQACRAPGPRRAGRAEDGRRAPTRASGR